jgi:hypothetical protein
VLASGADAQPRWLSRVGNSAGALPTAWAGVVFPQGKGADMADKSPRKTVSKKPTKTIKEKRQVKKEKQQAHKGLVT